MKDKKLLLWMGIISALLACEVLALDTAKPDENTWFAAPKRGFISRKPARDWEHSLLTGNGTAGAMVMGDPCMETIYLSHAALYLPMEDNDHPFAMAKHLDEIRELCLNSKFVEAGNLLGQIRKESDFSFGRDPFIGGFSLQIEQPEVDVTRYQRAVDFMTAEARVTYSSETGTVRRSIFASRPDDVIVFRIDGSGKQNAAFAFGGLPPETFQQVKTIASRVKNSGHGLKEEKYLYFQTSCVPNVANPIKGYEGLGRMVVKGGWKRPAFVGKCWTHMGLEIQGADEILLLIKIRPILKDNRANTSFPEMEKELEALPADYDTLLARHVKLHAPLMERVSFSLDAPASDRAKPSEDLIKEAKKAEAPLAQVERAFDAGRYNIICSTGYNPPNLQGLWGATWLAPWGGAITVDGNVQTAMAFSSMGNTPELTETFVRFMERFMPDFRRNTQELYGMRGFHVPAQIAASPRITDFSPVYSLAYWNVGAPWFCKFIYDHWLYTGDRKFLEERGYPMLKEAAAFYEDFLTVTDKKGQLVFVPSYSPENAPDNHHGSHTCINATMDIGAAKQLLNHAIAAAKELGRDEALQKKWAEMIAKLPPYEVGADGSFREWLWPDWPDNNEHRSLSHLYPLYDEMPSEILENPALLKAVGHTLRERMSFHERTGQMAYGIALIGLVASHTTDAQMAQRALNLLAKDFWSTGMGSFHCPGTLFNMDISGGLPALCASSLVYSDPGLVRFFPARPEQWKSGSIKGLRLRGAITLGELTWNGGQAKAVLVSDKDQMVKVVMPGGGSQSCKLNAGKPLAIDLAAH